jgi:hypothetical protein
MKSLAMLAALSLAAVSSSVVASEGGQCIDNYTKEGSFFSGRTFKTWAVYPKTPSAAAFKKVYAKIVTDGFKVTQADKDLGVIAAQQDVNGGNGKTIPVNVLIEDQGGGSKVSVTVITTSGLSVGEAGLQKGLCDIMNAAEK